jgi:hypothetical protein
MADTTLEYGMKGWDGELNKTAWLYGGGTSTHRCQDWSALVEYAVAHRTGDKRNLLSSKGSVEVS